MKPSLSTAAVAVAAMLFAIPAHAQSAAQPSPTVALKPMTSQGCFSSAGTMEDQGSYTFQTAGYCQKVCVVLNKPVMATSKGSNCWCGDDLPPASSKVSDSQCNSPCQGYDQATCGGENTFSVLLDGLENSVASSGSNSGSNSGSSSSKSTTSGTTSASPSVITEAGATIIVTATSSSKSSSGGGPSKASLAAGIVVGVVGICGIVGGLIYFLKVRKRKAVEEAYRRNAAINNFVNSGPKSASEGSVSDSRLDPSIMVQRRMSDGSIADNQDYSRRILKVTNPDDRA